jgi:sulfofructose kinase
MGDLQIVGLGLSTLDVLMRLKDMPTWERGGWFSEFRFDGGGPVGTALVAAARLGAKTGFVGTAGNDKVAELKMQALTTDGVDVSRAIVRPRPENQIVLCYVHEETGERVFAGVRGAFDDGLQIKELDRDYITSAEYLLLEGFHYEAAVQAAKWMHEAGKKVMLDAGKTTGQVSPALKSLVELTDVLICGAGFVPALTGVEDIWEAGKAVLEMGPCIVVQTMGTDGSYTVTTEEQFHTPAFKVDVVDTTGAGDVFHGAYLVGLLHGWDLRHISTFATAVSAIKCTRLGGRAGIPRYEKVVAFLRERGIEIE